MDNGYDFEAMLAYLRQRLDAGADQPAVRPHQGARTLPYGGTAHLVSGQRGFKLTISDYPTL
jgi:muramoyltetrapeptide carboxypeptidase